MAANRFLGNGPGHGGKVMGRRFINGGGKSLRDFELGNKIGYRIIPFVRVFLQRSQEAFFQHGRNGGVVLGGSGDISLHMLQGNADSRFSFKRKVVGQHFIEHDT